MLLMWFVVSTDGQKPNVGNMKLFPVHINNDISCTACSLSLTPGQVGCVNGVAEKLPTGVSPCLPCTSKPLYCCAPCPVSRTEERERLDRSLSGHIRFLHVDIQIQVHRAYKLIATAARTSAH